MKKQPITITITGAAGQIGYALLFRIASGQVFGAQTPVNLHLLELEAALPALEGVAMELQDCAFPLLNNIVCTSDLNKAMEGTQWVLSVGAVPRKAGMERADLLKINGGIFTAQGRAINDHAADDVRVLVVGNPCNTNCLIAMHHAPDVPRDRFYAMTRLDENRARSQLASKAGVPVSAVNRMVIWGNHSSTQYPDFYNATIEGESVAQRINDEAWLQGEFISTVQQRGAAIIKARGASSAASAANAAMDSVVSVINDTTEGEWFSLCKASQGEYQVDEGLIFSYPCVVKNGELSVVEGITHSAFGEEKLKVTLDELRQERDAVKQMGLI